MFLGNVENYVAAQHDVLEHSMIRQRKPQNSSKYFPKYIVLMSKEIYSKPACLTGDEITQLLIQPTATLNNSPIINLLMEIFFIKILNKLQVSAMLSFTQAVHSYIKWNVQP